MPVAPSVDDAQNMLLPNKYDAVPTFRRRGCYRCLRTMRRLDACGVARLRAKFVFATPNRNFVRHPMPVILTEGRRTADVPTVIITQRSGRIAVAMIERFAQHP